jgi:5-methylcytosine-specific restriction endonuclease McrA
MNFAKAQIELKERFPKTIAKSVNRDIVNIATEITMTDAPIYHKYDFNGEIRTYKNKLTLGNPIYLGETTKYIDHWAGKPKEVILKKDEYYIYEVKGEKWYSKTEQPLLLEIHIGSKYLGVGVKVFKKPLTSKEIATELRKQITVVAPEKIKGKKHKYPASVKTRTPQISKINNFAPYFCCYCETQLNKGNYTREHLVPTFRGGSNKVSNLRPACRTCNTEKDNLMLHSYIQMLNLQMLDVTGQDLIRLQTKIKNANSLAKELENDINKK